MSNKNKGKNKRTSTVSVDQSAAKKKKNAPTPASTPSKTRQNQVEKTLPELSSDDSLTDLLQNNNSPTAASNTSITNKDDNEKPIELPQFTFDDMNKLLDNVKKALPDNDILKFNTRLDKLDWEKVKFDNFSADDCRKLVIYAISFQRKFKTLSEILSDAKVSATKPNSKIYRQSNKDSSKPRHPSSSYMIFANEIRDKLRKQHPNLSIIEIGKLIGEKWRQLPDSKKEKYVKKFEENKKVYLEEISKYNIEHNHQPVNQKKKDLDKPRTPLSIYLSEKLEKDDNPDLEGKTLKEKQIYYKAKYNQLSDKKKFKYIKKCMDAEDQFVEKLKDKLKTSNVDYKTVLNKNERDIVEKMNGKPENPAANGYALFIKENITKPEIANVEPKQRNQLLATKWKELNKNERDDYNSRAKSMQEKFANDMQIYAKNLPEKEAIELYMSNTIPSFAKEILQKRIESFAN